MTHDITEQYLNDKLKPQLTAICVPDVFIGRIAATVREQMLSCIYHWNDESFRKTLLLIGEEEGSFYQPKAGKDVRNFVVVTLRNSALESIHADSYRPITQGKRLTADDIRAITSAAIEYFKEVDFPAMAEQIGLPENDKYGELAKKYPVSWAALTMLSNTTTQVTKYNPITITTKPDLNILKQRQAVSELFFNKIDSQIVHVTADGYSLTIDPGLRHIIKTALENELPFISYSFKGLSRNIEKLLVVMEYVLCNERAFITTNYYIANGHVERRMKPLKPGHNTQEIKRNWLNADGITRKHKYWLKTAAESN